MASPSKAIESRKAPAVTIVVGVRNMRTTIGKCIESLLKCEYQDKDIIIVDDGSSDGTPDVIRKYPVKLVSIPASGIAKARDIGYKESHGDIVAYTDADCEVQEDWVLRFVKYFANPSISAVTGRTVFQPGTDVSSLCRSAEYAIRYGRLGPSVKMATGPNCAFRRSSLEQVGGFDVGVAFGEDAVVSYRLIEAGLKIVYDDKMIVHHVPEQGLRRYYRKRYRDAKSFVGVAFDHRTVVSKDRFVGFKVVTTPFISLSIIICLALAVIYGPLVYVVGALLAVSAVLESREALLASRIGDSRLVFFKALLLLLGRGFVQAGGLVLGVLGVMLGTRNKGGGIGSVNLDAKAEQLSAESSQ